jgi:hypothetical protein
MAVPKANEYLRAMHGEACGGAPIRIGCARLNVTNSLE